MGRTVPGGSSSPGPRCPHWSGRHGLPVGESRLCPSLGRCCSTGDTGVQVPSRGVSTLHRPGLGLHAPSLWLGGTAPPEEVSPGRAPTHSPLSLHVKVTAPPHSRVTAGDRGDSGDSGGSGWHSVTVVAAVRPQCICPRRFPSGRERAEKMPVTLPLAPNTSGSHLGEASQLVSVAPRRRSVSSLRSTVLRGAAARGGEVSHSFSRPRLDGNPHPAPGRRGRGTNRDAVGKTHRAAPSANEASSPRTVCGARGKASGPFYP